MPDRFLVLHGRHVSLILETIDGGAPIWRYWGLRLPDGVVPDTMGTRALPSFALDCDLPLSVFPTFGLGWFGQSALLAHRDGHDFAQGFMQSDVRASGTNGARITLTDTVAAVEVVVTLDLDPVSDVLSLSSKLTNTGDGVLDVQWLAAGCVPLPTDAHAVRSWGGRHNNEFVEQNDMLGRTIWRRENRRGLTSHEDVPGAIVAADGATYGAQLAWSGNHTQCIEWLDDGRYQWQMGEWLAPGEVRLMPRETMSSPDMLATCGANPNAVAQNFHAAVRSILPWPKGAIKPRPVHLNTWEALYFHHREDDLKALADAAAAIGIERFVLDDGWFVGRNDDTSSLGDWMPDPGKYPEGLGPLARHVTALGMEFGLWVEPEMVNPDSDLFRTHPDWALQIAGRPLLTGRNQLVLDMANAEVSEFLFGRLSALLGELPISYLKWDHNRALATAAGGNGRPCYRQQVLASYALLDRIGTAFPDIEIEACAGGGGRIDAGIARRTHRFWTSDNIDAVSRVSMQRALLQFMPPETMGAHVGASPSHATGRRQSLNFRAAVALPGHFGVELDPRRLNDAERAALTKWIARYKDLRGVLHGSGVWTGTAADGVLWQAHGSVAELILFALRVTPVTQRYPSAVPLAMLDVGADYRIERIDRDEDAWSAAGAWLRASGLTMPPLSGEDCAIYRLLRT